MQNRRIPLKKLMAVIALLGTSAFLLASCNAGGVGIFYSLQNETKIVNLSSLADTLTVGSMLSLTVGTQPVYYIGADKVYEATHSSPPSQGKSLTWNAVTPPDSTHVLSTQVATDGTNLYAVYSTTDGTSSLVYQSTPGSTTLSKPSWAAVSGYSGTTASGDTYTVQSIFVVNGYLFVSVMYTSGTNVGLYGLYQGGDTSSPVLTSSPAVAGTFDTSTSTYWFAIGNKLYSGTSPTGLTAVASAAQPTLLVDVTFRSIYYSSTLNSLFVTTSDGKLYGEKSGTTSFGSATAASWPSSITATGLDGFGEFTSGSTDVILVGADTGYYELDINPASFDLNKLTLLQPGNTGTLSANVNYLSSTLKSAHVIGFFGDANPTYYADRFFALTGGTGLWRSEPDSTSTPRVWDLE